MPDTFTSRLRVRLQETGANTDTWGALLNSAALQLLEDAIAGSVDVTIAASDVTLTTANGATDQSRYAALNLIGSPAAARNVIVPSVTKIYLVLNNTTGGFAQTVRTLAGTGVSVAAGSRVLVFCDGTNVVSIQADVTGIVATATNALQLGGVVASSYARLDVSQNWTRSQAFNFNALTDGGTVTVDCTLSNNHRVVLAGNRIIALSSPKDGQEVDLWLVQDGTGGRTLTWPANVRWEGGNAPTLSTGAGAIDRVRLKYHLATDIWSAEAILNSASGGATTFNLTLDRNEDSVDLFRRVGSPGSAVTVNLTIARGVVIGSRNVRNAGLNLAGFASSSTINILNLGYIVGMGGRGGRGAAVATIGGGDDFGSTGEDGQAGGNAINGPGAGITVNITNANGRIWGGGGGGGGGGAGAPTTGNSAGGGGGGGAGGGQGGPGGSILTGATTTAAEGNPGADGFIDLGGSDSGGTAGTGAVVGAGDADPGGDGGDFGDAGSAGVASSSTLNADPGSGGAAGKAIELNGGSVTFVSGNSAPNVKGAVS